MGSITAPLRFNNLTTYITDMRSRVLKRVFFVSVSVFLLHFYFLHPLAGRRGVFDGTIENMHLHWKYRELVKILVKAKSFADVKRIALSLEAESGGILVSVDKVSKGYAIVVFRGKNYRRPSSLRPRNLLSKRKALARSIELQRHQVPFRFCGGLLKVELTTYVGLFQNQRNTYYAFMLAALYTMSVSSMVIYLAYNFYKG